MRKISSRNGEGGFVLTKTSSVSPVRMLVCEQKPSIHGHRYFVAGSMCVLVRSQSRVPGRAFSRRTESLVAGFSERNVSHPARATAAPAPIAPLIKSRRDSLEADL